MTKLLIAILLGLTVVACFDSQEIGTARQAARCQTCDPGENDPVGVAETSVSIYQPTERPWSTPSCGSNGTVATCCVFSSEPGAHYAFCCDVPIGAQYPVRAYCAQQECRIDYQQCIDNGFPAPPAH